MTKSSSTKPAPRKRAQAQAENDARQLAPLPAMVAVPPAGEINTLQEAQPTVNIPKPAGAAKRHRDDPFRPDPVAQAAAKQRIAHAVDKDVLSELERAEQPRVEVRPGGKFALKDVTADAALMLFADGAILYVSHKDGRRRTKWVNFSWVRKAFAGPVLSPLLAPSCRMWGSSPGGAIELHVFPAARRQLRFRPASLLEGIDGGVVQGDVLSVTLPMPPLLWVRNGRTLNIWALDDDVLRNESRLYRAPLPNVNERGQICFGANDMLSMGDGLAVTAWNTFWESPFNNHWTQNALAGGAPLFKLYREIANAHHFPLERLRAGDFQVSNLFPQGGAR